MRIETDREYPRDAILVTGEGDAAFDAWTLEELSNELGDLGAVTGSDDARA
jgi:hypothetical protein